MGDLTSGLGSVACALQSLSQAVSSPQLFLVAWLVLSMASNLRFSRGLAGQFRGSVSAFPQLPLVRALESTGNASPDRVGLLWLAGLAPPICLAFGSCP